MKIYNTLTNKLEEFIPINKNKINMYVCGPTVYSYAHVGNMRPVIFFDTIYRYFKYLGYEVTYASNFTDVDDKIINTALNLGITEKELADKFINIYLNDIKSFNCLDIDYRPKVTETMEDIIDFISLLLEKGYAYKNGEDVFFDVSKVKNYGELSNQKLENLEYGNRVEVSENKKSPYDFVLWKKTDKGITWNAPFGKGRPGWHTECVVMINKIFKGQIDIHGGGVDLKFPHHENECAQSYAAWNHSLAKYWIHNGHVKVEGEKMSKSLNNFILAHELREKYSSNVIRIGMLKTHYRSPIDLTEKLFNESITINEKINNSLKQAKLHLDINNEEYGIIKRDEKIEEYMDDDFNTSNLITYVLSLVKELNNSLRNNNTNISQLYDRILLTANILGLEYDLKTLNKKEKDLYKSWQEARNNKEFQKADSLREELIKLNIL